ncbi:MAG: adenylate/guanylate cyclase domain-containing protein [Pseudomonadota bacterium]
MDHPDATPPTTPDDAASVVEAMRQQIADLEQENRDLHIMLETTAEHADTVSAALEEERQDLETLLEMTTEHADVVEDELQEQAAEALRKSEQQLRMIVEATPVPVLISRLSNGAIVFANNMMGELFATPVDELLGQLSESLFADPEQLASLMSSLSPESQVDREEIAVKGPNDRTLWVEVSLRVIDFNDEPSILAALHDITDLREMNKASQRFVPQDYLSFLDKSSITDIALGDYVTGEMTVMFSDLRGFTSVSENMTPEDNFAFINSYLGRVSPVVREHRGFIIKYLGDGIHAIFPQRADDGVGAGIEKLETVKAYNEYRLSTNRQPIQIGIGVNTGSLMVGMVGESDRMQGDSFSDDVNLTARIEGLTKFYGVNFIITEATRSRLETPDAYNIRFLDKVQVVGRSNALTLYEVYAADPADQRDMKDETLPLYQDAIDLYYAAEFPAAQSKLFSVMQRNPRDKVAWHHLVNATRLADNGAPVGWTGVTVMTRK